MEQKGRKLKEKAIINKSEENNKNASRVAIKSTAIIVSIIVIITILVVTILTVILSTNATKETQGKEISAMAQKGDYIKEIEKVETSNEYMTMKTDADGVQVPVPKGYVGSNAIGENKVSGGYVIYEGIEEVNDGNVVQARKERNQYVWVPVSDVSQMYGIDADGKMWGKLYDFTMDMGDEINPITGAKPYNWKETNGIINVTSSTRYREPDIIKDRDLPRYFRQYGLGEQSTGELLMNLEKEFETSIESIAKYGGFYIGRYETGGLDGKVKVVRMDTQISNKTWYEMYEKCKKLAGTNDKVITSMIFGSQFDRVLMWLIESNNKTKEQVITNSGEWGNYIDIELKYDSTGNEVQDKTKSSGSSTRIPAGSCEETKANNIYDLAGNEYEWTIEANNVSHRVMRGGSCSIESNLRPAIYRNSSNTPNVDNESFGCRSILLIK